MRISNSKIYHYTRHHTFSPVTTFWDVTSYSLVRVPTFESNLPHLLSDPPAHIYQTTQRHIPEHSDLRIMIIRQGLFLRCFRKPRLLTQCRLYSVKYVTIEYSCCLLRSPDHWLHSLGFSCFSLAPRGKFAFHQAIFTSNHFQPYHCPMTQNLCIRDSAH